VSGTAQSSYGTLHASSAESFSGSTTPVFSYVNATANFLDGLTISFAPFTGETGYLVMGFTLDGTNAQTGSLNAVSSVSVTVGTQNDALVFTSSAPPKPWSGGLSRNIHFRIWSTIRAVFQFRGRPRVFYPRHRLPCRYLSV
jgi:hypothetical protein